MNILSDQVPPECPVAVQQPHVWNMARRIYLTHRRAPVPTPDTPQHCVHCSAPWPCFGRKVGYEGIVMAYQPGPPIPPEAQRTPEQYRAIIRSEMDLNGH